MMKRLLSYEPAILMGVIQAALALAVSFGAELTAEQTGSILAFTAAVLALVLRQSVVSPAHVVDVARRTAESLSGPSAGAVGTVTTKAEAIIDGVVGEVGGFVGNLAPSAKE